MDLLTALQDNWSILVSIVGLIWSYANLKWHVWQLHTKVMEHEQQDKEKWARNDTEHWILTKKVETLTPAIYEIKEQLARIETTLAMNFKKR